MTLKLLRSMQIALVTVLFSGIITASSYQCALYHDLLMKMQQTNQELRDIAQLQLEQLSMQLKESEKKAESLSLILSKTEALLDASDKELENHKKSKTTAVAATQTESSSEILDGGVKHRKSKNMMVTAAATAATTAVVVKALPWCIDKVKGFFTNSKK